MSIEVRIAGPGARYFIIYAPAGDLVIGMKPIIKSYSIPFIIILFGWQRVLDAFVGKGGKYVALRVESDEVFISEVADRP